MKETRIFPNLSVHQYRFACLKSEPTGLLAKGLFTCMIFDLHVLYSGPAVLKTYLCLFIDLHTLFSLNCLFVLSRTRHLDYMLVSDLGLCEELGSGLQVMSLW